MTPLSNSSPEVLAALLGACVKTGCYPAALLRIDEGRQLVELIAPAVDFEGRSISYRADATTRAIRAACASLGMSTNFGPGVLTNFGPTLVRFWCGWF